MKPLLIQILGPLFLVPLVRLPLRPVWQAAYPAAWLVAMAGWWLVNRLFDPGRALATEKRAWNAYQVAYLAGGRIRAVRAAAAALLYRGRLVCQNNNLVAPVATGGERDSEDLDLAPELQPLERAVMAALGQGTP